MFDNMFLQQFNHKFTHLKNDQSHISGNAGKENGVLEFCFH